jgi:hypothetical protein
MIIFKVIGIYIFSVFLIGLFFTVGGFVWLIDTLNYMRKQL